MPSKPLSSYVLICEKLLHEKDGVFSAIRIVDIFYCAAPLAGVPAEQQAVAMFVVAHFQVPPEDDGTHSVLLDLMRPSGERTQILANPNLNRPEDEPKKAPGSPQGFSVAVQVGVIAKEYGSHQIVFSVDESEVATAAFTLQLASVENQS